MLTEAQIVEEIGRLRNRRPFVPFVIVSTAGDRWVVAEPSQIAMPGGKLVVVDDSKGVTTLNTNQVASVEANEHEEELRQSLRQRLLKQPFEPFCILMAGGQRLPIVRYLQAAVGLSTFLVGTPKADGNIARQYFLRNVRSLEPMVIA